jgi:signal peptidase I
MRRLLGWLALCLVLIAILVPVAALTFSVQVTGHSMDPTLAEGDRLFVNFLGRGDVKRFDLVEAQLERGVGRAVKRVIGMPGDKLSIEVVNDKPRVLLQPEGEDTTYVVENAAWPDQIGAAVTPCCSAEGVTSQKATTVTVPAGSYWLIGDNWGGSDDSRKYGFVASAKIAGRLNFRVLPLGRLGNVEHDIRLTPVSP